MHLQNVNTKVIIISSQSSFFMIKNGIQLLEEPSEVCFLVILHKEVDIATRLRPSDMMKNHLDNIGGVGPYTIYFSIFPCAENTAQTAIHHE